MTKDEQECIKKGKKKKENGIAVYVSGAVVEQPPGGADALGA